MTEVPLTTNAPGAGHRISASSARQSTAGEIRPQSVGEGSSARKLSECTTDAALIESGAIDSWGRAEVVGGGADEAADSGVQAVVRDGGRPSCGPSGLTQQGGRMNGLAGGGTDGHRLNFSS